MPKVETLEPLLRRVATGMSTEADAQLLRAFLLAPSLTAPVNNDLTRLPRR